MVPDSPEPLFKSMYKGVFSLRLTLSSKTRGDFGVVGHVGVGHVHSHSGFVQDDSVGFAVVSAFLRDVLETDTTIKEVEGDPSTGTITVETFGGGVGISRTRRGLTPWDLDLLQRAVGEDGIYSQKVGVKAFGRMYGQGSMETPVALQGAVALSVMDTLVKASNSMAVTEKAFPGIIDKMAGMVLDLDGTPISFLLNINGTEGGIGPDEDLEGNTALGEKGVLMSELGLPYIPTIVVESKAFIPAMKDKVLDNTFFIRAQRDVDNPWVSDALVEAVKDLGFEYIFSEDALPQKAGQLRTSTSELADRIIRLGQELKEVDASRDKVIIVAKLAQLISEDAGGVTFMSNSLHEIVRGAGMVPGTSAVLSMLVPEHYKNYYKIPVLGPMDVANYQRVIISALKRLMSDGDKALSELKNRIREV